jgi:hypothetical protein
MSPLLSTAEHETRQVIAPQLLLQLLLIATRKATPALTFTWGIQLEMLGMEVYIVTAKNPTF